MNSSLADIVTSRSLDETAGVLDELQEGDLLLVDIDDTLITPVSKIFHDPNKQQHFIDELKAEKEKVPDFPDILGTWRLKRNIQLVNDAWPAILKTLQDRGVIVLGFTQMETGACGPIPSMEEWRFYELQKWGVAFTEKVADQNIFTLKANATEAAVFHKGIIMTGPFLKGEILDAFLTYTHLAPKMIVFFDDKKNHVQDVAIVAQKYKVPYLGIHFREVDKLLSSPDPAVVNFQKEILIREREWLEDETAEQRLQALKTISN